MTALHIVDPARLLGEALADSSPDLMRANLMSVTPKSMWPAVKAMLHSVYDQPDADAVNAQFDRLLDYVDGKLLAEQTDEWAEGRRYLGLDILAKSRLTLIPDTGTEATTDTVLELSA